MFLKLFKIKKSSRSFTIPELLVALSIAAILMTALIILSTKSYSTAKARDSKRVSEINTIRTALQLYYMDKGKYPTSTSDEKWCSLEAPAGDPHACEDFFNKLQPYLLELPKDPLFGKNKEPSADKLYSYQYVSTSSGQGYKIHADMETMDRYELSSLLGNNIVYGESGDGGGGGAEGLVIAMGGASAEKGHYISKTSDGGYIITGETYTWITGIGPDVLLIKLDADKEIEWAESIGSTMGGQTDMGYVVEQSSDGGYIITGSTWSGGQEDLLLMKLNNNGNLSWVKSIGGALSDIGYSLLKTIDGGYIVLGNTRSFGADNNRDLFLVKFSSGGNVSWARKIGGAMGENGNGEIQQKSNGNYVLTGPTASWGAGDYDVLLLEIDSSGNFLQGKVFGGGTIDRGDSLKITDDDGFIIGGYTYSFGQGGSDMFLLKLRSDMFLEWAKTAGGSSQEDIGDVQKTSDGYISTGDGFGFGSAGQNDLIVSKFRTDGSLEWAGMIGGPSFDVGEILQKTPGGYIIAGETKSFGLGDYDVFLVNCDAEGEISNCVEWKDITSQVVVQDKTTSISQANVPSSIIQDITSQVIFNDITGSFVSQDISTLIGIDNICPN